MSKLRLMKAGYGDLTLAEWDAVDDMSAKLAHEEFMRELKRGCLAFRLNAKGDQTPIREFDPTAQEILLCPPIRGG